MNISKCLTSQNGQIICMICYFAKSGSNKLRSFPCQSNKVLPIYQRRASKVTLFKRAYSGYHDAYLEPYTIPKGNCHITFPL